MRGLALRSHAALALSFLLTSVLLVGSLFAGCERPSLAPPAESPALSPTATATPTARPTEPPAVAPTEQGFELELIIDPPGSGFVAAIPPFSPYAPGTSVTLAVIPPRVPPYVFSHWTGDASGTERGVQVVMDGPKRVVARFFNPYITPPPAPEEE